LYDTARTGLFPGVDVDKSFLRKTAELVGQHTTSTAIGWEGRIHELDSKSLESLAQSDASDTAKVVNLIKVLTDLAVKERATTAYSESVSLVE